MWLYSLLQSRPPLYLSNPFSRTRWPIQSRNSSNARPACSANKPIFDHQWIEQSDSLYILTMYRSNVSGILMQNLGGRLGEHSYSNGQCLTWPANKHFITNRSGPFFWPIYSGIIWPQTCWPYNYTNYNFLEIDHYSIVNTSWVFA